VEADIVTGIRQSLRGGAAFRLTPGGQDDGVAQSRQPTAGLESQAAIGAGDDGDGFFGHRCSSRGQARRRLAAGVRGKRWPRFMLGFDPPMTTFVR
jgi:hypothetical protein